MTSVAESYVIHIRSKDCLQLTPGYNTNLQINLAACICRGEHQRLHVSVSSAEIPHSWYSFSSVLQTNQIIMDGSAAFTLADANYDVYEMIILITTSLTFPYAATYSENTSKITLTNTDSTSHTLNFLTSPGLAKALGFDVTSNLTILAGGTATGSNVINFATVHSMFLHSTLSVANVISTEHGNYEPILDMIPVNIDPFEIIHFNPYETAPFSSRLNDTSLRTFQVSIRDQNCNLIQLNGANFEVALLVEVHDYQPPEVATDPNKRPRTDIEPTPVTTISQPTPPTVPDELHAAIMMAKVLDSK
jgi:hypothetical protein